MIPQLLVVLACVASATAKSIDLNTYTFDEYMKDFRLKFSAAELPTRKETFLKEIARVQAHNARNTTWTEGINKYSVMTAGEKKAFMGYHKGKAHNSKGMLKNEKSLPENFKAKSVRDLPAQVDWRTKNVVTSVKDQGHCGSCWAFASTEVMESHVAIASGKLFDLSTEQVAMCTPNPDSCGGTGGCFGATSELAFEYVSAYGGLLQEYQYPYISYYGLEEDCKMPYNAQSAVATIEGYVKLPVNDYASLMTAVAEVGPVALAVDASNWHAYTGGIYDGCNQVNPDINHGVVLVGYGQDEATGEKYWLIRNSWSPSFGELGYIRVARHENEGELCGTDITPQDGIACAGDDSPVTVCGTCGVLFDGSYPLNARSLV